MTHAIDSIRTEPALPARGRLHVPAWVVPRERLAERLDRGVAGRVTLVTAPSGYGKTLGVTSWASTTQDPDRLLWLSAVGSATDPGLFLELLRDRVSEAGVPCPQLPGGETHEAGRTRALAELGRSLRRTGPWLLVIDDYPTGNVGALGDDLEVVLHHAQRGLTLVVISHGEPALAVQRHHVAGDLARIAIADLEMDWREVTEVLAGHGVGATELTARTVERHTGGWACGVRLAALALRGAPSIEAAMAQSDRATVDYLAAEVLGKAPARVRELLIRTSMVADVSPDLARAVLGPDADVELTPKDAARSSSSCAVTGRSAAPRCCVLPRSPSWPARHGRWAGRPHAAPRSGT